LAGVTVTEIDPSGGYSRAFRIDITQPVDHNNPAGQTFIQRLYLHHADESLPMIFNTNGYAVRANYINELAGIISSNHICVAHRYFVDAKPNPLDWKYLTIQQAAADHHRIVEMLKTIYQGKWITTGVSKGGTTALIHRRFYPDDGDVTVAYIAPISLGIEDPRYDDFLLNRVATAACRKKIRNFQRRLLEKRDQLIPFVENFLQESSDHFSLGADGVFEYAVMEYLFVFWQYGPRDCSVIPDESASDETLFNHLSETVGLEFFSDESGEYYAPHYYQAYTQMGYYRLITDHLEDLLVSTTDPSYSIYCPKNVDLNFEPWVMQDLLNWLQNSGNNIIYLYGALDPYTAAAVELTGNTNAVKIVKDGFGHGIWIKDLNDSEKDLIYDHLESWLGITINRSNTNLLNETYRPLYFKKRSGIRLN